MKCGGCSAVRAEGAKAYSVCGGCKEMYYCSRECQKKDWKTHKPDCLSSDEREAQRQVVKESTVRPLPFQTDSQTPITPLAVRDVSIPRSCPSPAACFTYPTPFSSGAGLRVVQA